MVDLDPVCYAREYDASKPSYTDVVLPDSQDAEMWAYTLVPLYPQSAIDTLRAEVERLRAEVVGAWTRANHAEAKVRGWESTLVCAGLPERLHPVDSWGPGRDGTVSVPQITPEKLTSILDRLERAEAEAAALGADAERYRFLAADHGVAWEEELDAAMSAERTEG